MRTSVATVCLSGSLTEKLHACAAAGFDGVEIFEPDLVATSHSPEEIRALADRLGLTLDLYQPFRDFEGVTEPLLTDNLRLAAFVDGGRVWASRSDTLVGESRFRFTPGLGVRLFTPVGPIRVDAAYNPYKLPVGPLYTIAEDGSLVVTEPAFDPNTDPRGEEFRRDSFWRRIQIFIAVGQAF